MLRRSGEDRVPDRVLIAADLGQDCEELIRWTISRSQPGDVLFLLHIVRQPLPLPAGGLSPTQQKERQKEHEDALLQERVQELADTLGGLKDLCHDLKVMTSVRFLDRQSLAAAVVFEAIMLQASRVVLGGAGWFDKATGSIGNWTVVLSYIESRLSTDCLIVLVDESRLAAVKRGKCTDPKLPDTEEEEEVPAMEEEEEEDHDAPLLMGPPSIPRKAPKVRSDFSHIGPKAPRIDPDIIAPPSLMQPRCLPVAGDLVQAHWTMYKDDQANWNAGVPPRPGTAPRRIGTAGGRMSAPLTPGSADRGRRVRSLSTPIMMKDQGGRGFLQRPGTPSTIDRSSLGGSGSKAWWPGAGTPGRSSIGTGLDVQRPKTAGGFTGGRGRLGKASSMGFMVRQQQQQQQDQSLDGESAAEPPVASPLHGPEGIAYGGLGAYQSTTMGEAMSPKPGEHDWRGSSQFDEASGIMFHPTNPFLQVDQATETTSTTYEPTPTLDYHQTFSTTPTESVPEDGQMYPFKHTRNQKLNVGAGLKPEVRKDDMDIQKFVRMRQKSSPWDHMPASARKLMKVQCFSAPRVQQ